MNMHHSRFSHGFGALLLLAVLAAAGSGIVMVLWNSVVTDVCSVAAVSFWQALGLLTLGLTLSGGLMLTLAMLIHAFGHHHHDSRRAMFEKWHKMSDEQRREFLSSRGFSIDKKD